MIDWKFIFEMIGIFIYVIFMGFIFMGIERKVMVRIQRRVGFLIYQFIIDIFKLFGKKESVSYGFIYDFGFVFVFGVSIVVFFFILIVNFQLFSINVDFIVVVYFFEVLMFGIMFGVMSLGNLYLVVGVQCGFFIMVVMQFLYGLVLIVFIQYWGIFKLNDIVVFQQVYGWSIMVLVLFLVLIVFDIVFQVMLGFELFDIILVLVEIFMGLMVEYGGKYVVLFFIQYVVQFFVEIVFFVVLFFGGVSNFFEFFIKQIVVLFILIFIVSIYLRFIID